MSAKLAFFELGVQDAERGRAFYEGLFGWTFETGPSGEGFTIDTPNVPGGMHGGDAGAVPYVFFEGDEQSTAKFGRFKLCRDDPGSRFGLHQPPRS